MDMEPDVRVLEDHVPFEGGAFLNVRCVVFAPLPWHLREGTQISFLGPGPERLPWQRGREGFTLATSLLLRLGFSQFLGFPHWFPQIFGHPIGQTWFNQRAIPEIADFIPERDRIPNLEMDNLRASGSPLG